MKNRIKKQIQKIIEVLKNDTAYMIISTLMVFGFIMGIFVERTNSNEKILKMQFDLCKRKLGDFYYDEKGDMEFRWKK